MRILIARLGLTSASGLSPTAPGAATVSLLASISRVVLTAAVAWQGVMVIVAATSTATGGWILVAIHTIAGVIAAASFVDKRMWPFLPVAMLAGGVASYIASGDIDSALTFAACWQINFAACFAGLLLLRRYAVWLVVGAALCTAGIILALLPAWGMQLPLSIVVTQTSIIVAIRLGISGLLSHAGEVDAAVRSADEAALRNESIAYQSARLAEESRMLHDTAINTFGAIAAGGAATRDSDEVRAQCGRDVAMIERLSGIRHHRPPAAISDIFTQPGLPMRRHGADDNALERVSTTLAPDVIDALVGCVREAVNNASHHSGADHVDIEVTIDPATLTVRVRDDGRGFDVDGARLRGVESSIVQRARAHGFTAAVLSQPGAGTEVLLRVPSARTVDDDTALGEDDALIDAAVTARRRSGAYWALGVTVVSVVLTIAGGTNDGFALYPMIGVMLATLALARIPTLTRGGPALPLALVVATIGVFVLSARATDFGTLGATHWQALAPTGPFILLLSAVPGLAWRIAGATAWLAAVVGLAAWVYPTSATGAVIVMIAGLVGLGFSAVWAMFQRLVVRLTDVASTARRHELAARLQAELETAAQASYERWLDAGLDDAAELLRGIRDGALTPESSRTRAACDEEERYLRQLVQISPSLVHLSGEVMPLLKRARDRDVSFALRLGDRDATRRSSASAIAQVIEAGIDSVGHGGALSATLFPAADGIQLTLSGAGVVLPDGVADHAQVSQVGDLSLIEMLFDQTDHSSAHRTPSGAAPTHRETLVKER